MHKFYSSKPAQVEAPASCSQGHTSAHISLLMLMPRIQCVGSVSSTAGRCGAQLDAMVARSNQCSLYSYCPQLNLVHRCSFLRLILLTLYTSDHPMLLIDTCDSIARLLRAFVLFNSDINR